MAQALQQSYMILQWELWRMQLGLHEKQLHCCNMCQNTSYDASHTTALQLHWQTATPAMRGIPVAPGLIGLVLWHESLWLFPTGTCLSMACPHEKHNEGNAPNPQQCAAHGIKHIPFNATQGTMIRMPCNISARDIIPGLILLGCLWVWKIWAFWNYNYPLPNPHYFMMWAVGHISRLHVSNLESRNQTSSLPVI